MKKQPLIYREDIRNMIFEFVNRMGGQADFSQVKNLVDSRRGKEYQTGWVMTLMESDPLERFVVFCKGGNVLIKSNFRKRLFFGSENVVNLVIERMARSANSSLAKRSRRRYGRM